jgi:DNA-binding SARP family transcriptional activator
MPRLAVRLLGPPIAELDGVPIEVDTRKATALLAYLAVTERPHARDSLAALLWPDYDQTSARAALRRTLSTLRKALSGGWVVTQGDLIGLDRDELWLDTERFHSLAAPRADHAHPPSDPCVDCLTALEEALRLYRDNFLAGFSLRDSPEFDDWQSLQAEALRRELAEALDRLIAGYIAQEDYAMAVRQTQRRLALDPLHEPAHRTLMLLYAWTGERGAALRQYRDCVRTLDEELGVAPLEDTAQLYHAIVEDQAPPPPRRSERAAPAPASERAPARVATAAGAGQLALVGRDTEWQALKAAYDRIGADGHLVILEGEAGIGKTRLADELTAHASAHGALILVAYCYEGESALVYGPFIQALRAAVASERGQQLLARLSPQMVAELSRLAPEVRALRPDAPEPPPLDRPGAQGKLFDAVTETLGQLCGATPPGVLLIEDLHWADEASLDLLSYLAHRLRTRPMCVVGTWRSESTAAGGRLRRIIQDGRRDGWATLVSLSRLTAGAVAELVQAGGPDDGASGGIAERLYEETEGVPFFVVEYLAALAQGRAPADGDTWALPGGVRELLRSRVANVSEAAWQVLTTAGVVGRSFEFDVLREASGRSEEEAVIALEELMQHGLVAEVSGEGDSDVAYDFSHEKLRTLVYEETSLARRRLLHRRVAGALTRNARGRRDRGLVAGQIAFHFRLAGDDAQAAEYYRLAGEHARALYANAEAVSHFQSALALGHARPADLHEAIGDLHTLAGEYGAALRSYETAAALAEPARVAVLEHKLAALHHRRGVWELAERHFATAMDEMEKSGRVDESARLYADWSLTAYRQGDVARALALAERSLSLAESAADTSALAQAHNILGILAGARGESDAALEHLERSLALAEELGDLSAQVAAMNNLALTHVARGETDRAIELTERALAACEAQGDRHREAALHNNLADALHAQGRTEAAMEHLKQAVAIFAEIGSDEATSQPEIWKLTEW